jgi:hydrogenase maturation protease
VTDSQSKKIAESPLEERAFSYVYLRSFDPLRSDAKMHKIKMKTLVLGLGNELYGDDGVGIAVVQKLKSDPELKKEFSHYLADVDIEECSLTGFKLLDVVIGYDRLIIIDTIKRENPLTGKISTLKHSDLRYIPGPSPHYVSIPQAIDIGRKLGLKVPSKIDIIAVEAKNLYNMGEGLTPEMTKAIPEIIQKLKEFLEEK